MATPRQYLAAVHALERKYSPVIERIITKFRKQFIASYKANPSGAHSALQQQVMNEDIIKVLRSIYRTAGLSGAKRQHDELKKAATQKAGGIGRNEQWIAEVITYLRQHGLEMAANITETMREDIVKILQMAVDNGWGIDQTVRELQNRYVIPRAAVIARTEINRASNIGHAIGAKDLPFEVDKKWIAARDERTRKAHRHVNGHITGENEAFKVPDYKGDKPTGTFSEMLYPGDPNAPAAQVCNCRCRVTYEPKRDSEGRLLLRNPNTATVIPMRRVPRIPVADIAAVLKSQIKIGVEE
jgi:hypothetical protein